jgi:hypothetical protein
LFTDNAIKARACKCVWWAFFKASRLSEINPRDLTLILWKAGNKQFRISYSNTQAGIKTKIESFFTEKKGFRGNNFGDLFFRKHNICIFELHLRL